MGKTISSYEKKCAEERKKYNGFEKYEAEGFSRSLEEAAEVLSDPKKLKAANAVLEVKKRSIKTLEGLKKYAGQVQED